MEKAVFVCKHIFEGSRPVLLVSHSEDDWQFLCGENHTASELPEVVGLNHILERDFSIVAIMDIPVDCEAERQTTSSPWIITSCDKNA
jgi:hypothetical protein